MNYSDEIEFITKNISDIMNISNILPIIQNDTNLFFLPPTINKNLHHDLNFFNLVLFGINGGSIIILLILLFIIYLYSRIRLETEKESIEKQKSQFLKCHTIRNLFLIIAIFFEIIYSTENYIRSFKSYDSTFYMITSIVSPIFTIFINILSIILYNSIEKYNLHLAILTVPLLLWKTQISLDIWWLWIVNFEANVPVYLVAPILRIISVIFRSSNLLLDIVAMATRVS